MATAASGDPHPLGAGGFQDQRRVRFNRRWPRRDQMPSLSGGLGVGLRRVAESRQVGQRWACSACPLLENLVEGGPTPAKEGRREKAALGDMPSGARASQAAMLGEAPKSLPQPALPGTRSCTPAEVPGGNASALKTRPQCPRGLESGGMFVRGVGKPPAPQRGVRNSLPGEMGAGFWLWGRHPGWNLVWTLCGGNVVGGGGRGSGPSAPGRWAGGPPCHSCPAASGCLCKCPFALAAQGAPWRKWEELLCLTAWWGSVRTRPPCEGGVLASLPSEDVAGEGGHLWLTSFQPVPRDLRCHRPLARPSWVSLSPVSVSWPHCCVCWFLSVLPAASVPGGWRRGGRHPGGRPVGAAGTWGGPTVRRGRVQSVQRWRPQNPVLMEVAATRRLWPPLLVARGGLWGPSVRHGPGPPGQGGSWSSPGSLHRCPGPTGHPSLWADDFPPHPSPLPQATYPPHFLLSQPELLCQPGRRGTQQSSRTGRPCLGEPPTRLEGPSFLPCQRSRVFLRKLVTMASFRFLITPPAPTFRSWAGFFMAPEGPGPLLSSPPCRGRMTVSVHEGEDTCPPSPRVPWLGSSAVRPSPSTPCGSRPSLPCHPPTVAEAGAASRAPGDVGLTWPGPRRPSSLHGGRGKTLPAKTVARGWVGLHFQALAPSAEL